MQFHLNGFRGGDPRICHAGEPALSATLDQSLDVLIVGSGPAGLTLAAQLAAFPEIKSGLIEKKPGPMELGQADGIACRTVEMFHAFGFAEAVMQEAYWVNETVFWRPDPADPGAILRANRIQDTEDGLSEFPHLILNQARVHDYYLNVMRHGPSPVVPAYNTELVELRLDADAEFPVLATIRNKGEDRVIRARYVVGCDGARSRVRQSMGLELAGDSANQAWGVMDVLAVTDFPDIRLKAAIQSAKEGNILVIPREGGYLARLYVEMDKLGDNERVASRNISIEHLIAAAKRILQPYLFEVKDVAWWSVYEIGQRLCARFDDVPADAPDDAVPRVFIAGDACHTHSPKAGQGMNVSMQDSFNLGWKLAAVLRGQAKPALLRTYSAERQAVAQDLIDFDREWAALFSAKPKTSDDDKTGVDPAEVHRYFVKHGRYTAGTETHYPPALLTGDTEHQALAQGFVVGKRFHSAPVIRLADAKPMHLGHTIKADGRWRLFVFAGRELTDTRKLADFLGTGTASPLLRYKHRDADTDAVIDTRLILQTPHRETDLAAIPGVFLPAKGRFGLLDYEKVFCPSQTPGEDIFELRGIDRDQGCMIIVRPDQYVAHILPLDGTLLLCAFFERFMSPV